MGRKIPIRIRKNIARMYDAGLSPKEISLKMGVPYATVYGHTRLRDRINPETGKKFESRHQYHEYLARQKTNPETGKPFESRHQYHEYLARQKTNPETGKKFDTLYQYYDMVAIERSRNLENSVISSIINLRLRELAKNKSWLSKQTGIASQRISEYAAGKILPEPENFRAICNALDIRYDTLESLLSIEYKPIRE
ncbi:MAG: helix-turn-helix domain-containing protein [Candidatus Woesearchaeota archaeon]